MSGTDVDGAKWTTFFVEKYWISLMKKLNLKSQCCFGVVVFGVGCLKDVEANTVRLKEHGQDVLVLEKITSNIPAADGTLQTHYK